MAKPKLALIPASQGSKVFSVLPSSGAGDFDFSRASKATRINSQGLIEEVANGQSRLEYPLIDGVVSGCPSLLLEPSRTNLFTYSEDFSNSNWTTLASGETIVSNSVISPDGTLNADTLEGDGTGTLVYVRNDVTLSTSVDYTFSIFAKKGTNDFIAISAEGFTGATNTLLIFDLNNSTVTNGTGNIKDYGNGWLRCSFTTAISTDGAGRFLIYPAYNGTTRGFPTSSDANGKNIYLWGAMVEEGSYPTSYIPTNGTAVTRAAETATGSGDASTFNDSEGVLFANIAANANDLTIRVISINDNSGNNVIRMGYAVSSNEVNFIVRATTNIYSYNQALSDITTINKLSISYSSSGAKVFINGFLSDSGALSSLPTGLSQLDFRYGNGSFPFYGKTKQLQYYNTVLTDLELETLTSYRSLNELVTELNLKAL